MKNPEEDLKFIKLSQSGDLDAFRHLVQRHEGWLRAWLRSKVRDWTAADDLAQDTFVTVFTKIRSFQGDDGFEAWIRKIAFNHFRNHLRKKREEYVGGDLELQTILTSNSMEIIQGNESLDALHDCMKNLDEPTCELLNDHYTAGKTLREISKETEIGYSALTMKLHRVRQSLALCIEGKLS